MRGSGGVYVAQGLVHIYIYEYVYGYICSRPWTPRPPRPNPPPTPPPLWGWVVGWWGGGVVGGWGVVRSWFRLGGLV